MATITKKDVIMTAVGAVVSICVGWLLYNMQKRDQAAASAQAQADAQAAQDAQDAAYANSYVAQYANASGTTATISVPSVSTDTDTTDTYNASDSGATISPYAGVSQLLDAVFSQSPSLESTVSSVTASTIAPVSASTSIVSSADPYTSADTSVTSSAGNNGIPTQNVYNGTPGVNYVTLSTPTSISQSSGAGNTNLHAIISPILNQQNLAN
jgi:hypothetical protein